MSDTPEIEETETPAKPTPPAPPAPGEAPPPPPARAELPAYDPGPSPPKSPPLAAVLSVLFPGAGHLYVWAYERAFMAWATIVVCIALIVHNPGSMWPFSFLIAFVYFFCIFDAYREAQFFNIRAEGEDLPKLRSDGHGRLMFGVFLSVVAAIVLADKFNLFDMNWIREWWPVPVFLLGVYFIIGAVRDRMSGGSRNGNEEEEY